MRTLTSSKFDKILLGFLFILSILSLSSVFGLIHPLRIYEKTLHFVSPRGADTKEELVQRYLKALEQNNIKEIIKLTPRNLVAESEAQEKLDQFGGLDLQDAQIEYRPDDMKPRSYITVHINGANINDYISIHLEPNGWYLDIGIDKWFLKNSKA